MQHALMLARRMLARQTGTKQVIMITDGEPTAHILPGGRAVLQLPAGAGDDPDDADRGGPGDPGGHPHQHLHARRHRLPARRSWRR